MKLPNSLKSAGSVLKAAAVEWNDDNAMRLSAALAYYTVFSLGPLLMIASGVAALVFGEEAARGELAHQMEGLVGKNGAEAVQGMLAGARREHSGLLASLVGAAVLIIGATGVFAELKASLGELWDTEPKASAGVLGYLKDRLLSFAMVLAIGFLLLVSLVLSAALSAVSKFAAGVLPMSALLMQIASTVVSLALITFLFALMYKYLPERHVRWRDVLPGALLAAVLFSVGKLLIGLYLGQSAVTSTFGASASLVVIMVWTYYSSLIFFFGAEVAVALSRRHGKQNEPGRREAGRAYSLIPY